MENTGKPGIKPALKVPRVVTRDTVEAVCAELGVTIRELIDVATMQAMLLGVPRSLTHKVDALATVCGHGHQERVREPIRVWETPGVLARYLLVSGSYSGEATFEPMTLDGLQQPLYGLRRADGVHVQERAIITPDQTNWIAARVCELGIDSLAIYSSQYHLLRTYLTMLRSLQKGGAHIPVVPVAVIADPSALIPEEPAVTAYEMAVGEALRVVKYREDFPGDVAGFEEFREAMRCLYVWGTMQSYRDDL